MIEPYSYAGDSPLNWIDPRGLARCFFFPTTLLAGYHDVGPLGPGTYKGCLMVGLCGDVNVKRRPGSTHVSGHVGLKYFFKYVKPNCGCPLWCTQQTDDVTGLPISKITCFDFPLQTMPPFI
jgi:hypothetical protein